MTHEAAALRLVDAEPLERLSRTLEALLVIASTPLPPTSWPPLPRRTGPASRRRLHLLGERYSEGRSGIVLELVAGGYAFRAARGEAAACARLVERPVERGLSQAALETLAIVAYLGPCTRPDIARDPRRRRRHRRRRSRRAGLSSRPVGGGPGGAIRYRTTELFERVFGLEALSELPRLDDLGQDAAEIRDRLEAVADAAPRNGALGNVAGGMDITDETFYRDVLERSHQLPVVVDFWADWCGPCKALTPLLESEVEAREGRVALAKVDVDANPAGSRSTTASAASRPSRRSVTARSSRSLSASRSAQGVAEFLDELFGPAAGDRLIEELRESGEQPDVSRRSRPGTTSARSSCCSSRPESTDGEHAIGFAS